MTRYSVILADPPWRYRQFSDAAQGAVSAQYDTMGEAALLALPVASWAADDSVLAMWGTWPKLDEGVRLLAGWGFRYVTGLPWVKVTPSSGEIRRGIGFWTQSASELLLLGRRGDLARKDVEPVMGLLTGESRVFYSPSWKHSQKPLDVHGWLSATFDGPYLEMFARALVPGWTCWGIDTGFRLTPRGAEPVVQEKAAPLPLWGGP